ERKGYPVIGTTFGAIDYPKLGAAFGIEARTVSTVAECRDAFGQAPHDRPTLIAARIDPAGYRVG
ncbi:MAG TPA: hypothetical protein VEN31_07000, partial [Candidatus Bathyarchaeia archaeon]|nr:hypothetical protein [Candidatus Bathyarchaeia archaeon]